MRLERVSQLIKKELAHILLKEIELREGIFATITRVKVSKTLEHCTVFISVFPEKESSAVLNLLKNHIFDIQKILDKRLKMRFVPKISFKKEENLEKERRLEDIFDRVEKELKLKNQGHVAK
jgi:ribosome-binding factor A